jgi:Xaa-Pro aminopeptidase
VKERVLNVLMVGSLIAVAAGSSWAQSPEDLQTRRQAVRDAMDPDSVMILRSAQPLPEVAFHQESNFYYLTGVNEPGAALVLYSTRRSGGGTPAASEPPGRADVLFLQPASPERSPAQGAAGAALLPVWRPGFAAVSLAADFQRTFESALLSTGGTVYLDTPRSRSLTAPLTADEQWLKAARDRGAAFTAKPASPLLAAIRPVKSPAEIATLTTAAGITAMAEREAMRSAKPGMFEYQIQAVVEHVFAVNGAARPGFQTIIGSGKNSCVLHWSVNARKTEPGDVVVMDIGAEYGMYTADITRTIPISGTFTTRQRQVYEIVLKANEDAIRMVGPGVNMTDINNRVNEVLTEGLIALGLIKDKSGLRQYYPHGLSHSVGLEVHDLGGALTVGVLKPGMVITIEPGLYIPAENLGVRIEDDVVVTEAGHEVITSGAPKTVAEVEKLMREPGMDFSRYLVKKDGTHEN